MNLETYFSKEEALENIPENSFVLFHLSRDIHKKGLVMHYQVHVIAKHRILVDQCFNRLVKEGWKDLELWRRVDGEVPTFLLKSESTY